MMMKSLQVLAMCLVSYGLVGCQQSADSPTEANVAPGPADPTVEASVGTFAREDLTEEQVPAGLTPSTPPEQIVAAFLDALRTGESEIAAALLTRRAREETRKRDLTVQHLGSPDATFTIGVPKFLGDQKNGAHVNTSWTETEDGIVTTHDIVWALRRHPVGWRVAGMGAPLGPGQPLVYLNFEDPDDMLTKWREADEALAAAEAAASTVRQAQAPAAPSGQQR